MAITTEVRGDILELLVLMFDAAPGATYLSDITALYESIPGTHAQKMQGLAFTLSNTGVFQSLHPNFQTAEEFATDFLSTLELENHAEARAWVLANYGTGSPANKAQIMYAGWNFLNSNEFTGDAGLARAKEIMLNKAEVSEYYSVFLGEAALDLATLQDVLADVDETQESVDAAIDAITEEARELRVLTPENDLIDVLNNEVITIEGIVDFDAFGNPNGTFNPGDNIDGNGFTTMNLVLVDGGDGGFIRLNEIVEINVEAGTNDTVTLNAAGWTDIGSVNLNSGVDGLTLFLDNLEAGTVISVSDVTGSISADYDTDLGNAFLWLRNNNEGGEGVTGVATAEGDITVTGSDSISVTIYDSNGVTLDDVSITLADESYFTMEFDDEGYTVGDVAVMMGESAFVGLGIFNDDVTGDQTYGNISVTVLDDSSVDIEFNDGEDGDITVGAIDVEMGANGDFTLSVSDNWTADVNVGNVSVVAGDESELDIWVQDNDGDIVFADIDMSAGLASTINVTFDGYGEDSGSFRGDSLTVGNVSLEAGDATTGDDGEDSYVNLRVEDFTSVDFGDISLIAGVDGTVDVSFSYIGDGTTETAGDLTIGNVNLEAGDYAEMTVLEATGDVTVGNVDITSGGSARFWIAKSGMGMGEDEVGAVTVGNVDIAAASGWANFTVMDYNQVNIGNVDVVATSEAWVRVEGEGNLANITMGNVSVSADADGAWASIDIDNTDDANAGSIMLGDLNASANGIDGEVGIYVVQTAMAETTEDNEGTAVGDITIGNISASVGSEFEIGEDGDYDVSISVWNSAWVGDGAMAGNVSVGDVHVTLGDGFVSGTLTNDAAGYLFVGNWGEDGMGDLSVGNVDIDGGDFVAFSVTVTGYNMASGSTIGDMSLGSVNVEAGESAMIDVFANWELRGGGGNLGSFTAGGADINVGQDSFVRIDLNHSFSATATTTSSIGDTTVGNIDITMGDNAEVYVYIDTWANFNSFEDTVEGDVMVGDITIAVSATESEDLSGGSNIVVDIESTRWNNDAENGMGGTFTVGNISVSAAGDEADIDVEVTNEGSWDEMGDASIGMISAAAANSATIDIDVVLSNYTTGEVGNVTLGGFGVDMGDDGTAVVLVDLNFSYTGDTGEIALGDFDVNMGNGSVFTFDLSRTDEDGDSVAGFSIGNISVVGGEDSYVDMYDMDISVDDGGEVGDVSIGNIVVDLGDDSEAYISPDVSSEGGEVGNVTVGNIDITLGADNTFSLSIDIDGDDGIGDVTVGNVSLDAGTGTSVSYLWLSFSADSGSIGEVKIGDIDLDFDVGSYMTSAEVYVYAYNDIDGVTIGNVSISAADDAEVEFTIDVSASTGEAGDLLIGDIMLHAVDTGYETVDDTDPENPITTDFGGNVELNITLDGTEENDLEVGNVTIIVDGENDDDEVWLTLTNNDGGDVIIGDVTVSGKGTFILDGEAHTGDANTSFLAVNVYDDGEITIGNVDFSGYEDDITLDLAWTDHGAANITAGQGNDIVYDNEGDNIITGNEGADYLDIGEDGADTIVTDEGDSGVTMDSIDTIEGFEAMDDAEEEVEDLLDFNYVAGTTGNFVAEDDFTYADIEDFIDAANDALNSTVRYFAAEDGSGNTWVAVNRGSGEADQIILLNGVDVNSLSYANFIA